MLQSVPPIEATIWTPTIQDVWMRWYYAARRNAHQRCWRCEDVEEEHFLLASLPINCVE